MTDYTLANNLHEGSDVYGSDGEKVGSIVAVYPNYIVVEKGFFFPTDYYIPVSAVNTTDEGRIYLNVTKQVALNQGWDVVPVDYDTAAAGSRITGSVTTVDLNPLVDPDFADTPVVADGAARAGSTWSADATLTDEERIAIPVREEDLRAGTRPVKTGQVRVEKDVVAEERTIDVPVTEERVRVERHIVDRPVTAADADAFEEAVIEVPVYGEDVVVDKTVRVAEEVEIAKEKVQRTQRVSDTVRREDVRIVDDVAGGYEAESGEDRGVIGGA